MIDVDSVTQKIKRFFERESVPAIVQDGTEYHVFGKYVINQIDTHRYDLYKHDHYVDTVASSAVAMSWCIFDSKNDWKNSHALIVNDKRIQDYRFQIENRKRILKTAKDPGDREWLLIRINEDVERMREAKRNLDKCVKLTKYIKIKGFNDNESR